jgi:hydrogenase nickel incorporation protein HypB
MNRVITIERSADASERLDAARFRDTMRDRGTLVVNLMSSPGSGKTSLLESTAKRLQGRYSMAVLVGDIATDRDAQRLAPWMPAIQLTTGGACHLPRSLVQQGWERLDTQPLDFLFIENVGNLVCPSSHDLGEHLRVVILATTEGDDKPAKYPKAFRTSQALVISKLDLLPYVPFSVDAATRDAREIRPDLDLFPLSALRDEGVDRWCDYLTRTRERLLAPDSPPSDR